MEKFSFIKYLPDNSNSLMTTQLVECYRDVFADQPWNEWLKCPLCQKHWGKKDQALLESHQFKHCGVPLVDFWPREKVLSDIYAEITPQSSCWLAMDERKVVGFCWGYPVTISELEAELGIILEINHDCPRLASIAYQDDIGVIAGYRGRKLAKAMFARRLDDFLAQGLEIGIVRVKQNPEPSQTFLWFTEKLGYRVIARYPEKDGRVILGREFNGLKELLKS